ncbi:MAG: YgiQ family radical SAM protein [Tenericutes bacterium 4572_104]|nr:MAG: YgiQ family radical SAM protein [Tenericutes bacterium 4572_104]
MPFLPITRLEMKEQNISQPDFVFVSGDAYCDHPSFGIAIISRILERHGFTVCILSQPNISNPEEFLEFGIPKLGWLISSGNIDSMVNHYTVNKRRRRKDYYTPGGIMGKRPDRAVIKYSNTVRKLDPSGNIILGGIESSLRRLGHYDYWSDSVKQSILLESKADILVYGMGELAIIEIAEAIKSGLDLKYLTYVSGTVVKTQDKSFIPDDAIILPEFKEITRDKKTYAKSFIIQYNNTDSILAKPLVEKYDDIYVIQNPPMRPLTRLEMDEVYNLPFMREPHPLLEKQGHIYAMDEVKFSIVANRGCFGGCSFCALTTHQGRVIQSRSKESIVKEAKQIISSKDFKGYIHDVGGPTANFYQIACQKQVKYGVCVNKACIGYKPCSNLEVSHKEYLDVLRTLRKLDNVKKVFIRSGIRYDYLMYDKNTEFFEELVKYHVSGQLKVAPEHVSPNVLKVMGKPRRELYDKFVKRYYELNKKLNKNQFLVPYLMSSHPGSTLKDAIILAEYVRDMNYNPRQVQDFYPTPLTLATTMYYTGLDPRTMEPIYVARTKHEKAMQRALIQYRNPKNYYLVHEALIKEGRTDLIGFKKHCLIKPINTKRN